VSRIVLAGGAGALGRALSSALAAAGHEVVVLTRSPRPGHEKGEIRDVGWDGRTQGAWARVLRHPRLEDAIADLLPGPAPR